ncbi:MAG TPA: nucleoside triphosphate pyrophosphohydrolase [Haliangiales bacterium]|nr:nucleoside triphosphate pyrophosphohydrolase [Haliangiales bacterium]
MRPGESLADLVAVMRHLLAPGGCPWDREQTLDTLKSYLLEETYEVLEAIEHGTPADHCEELGDLLMQIAFQAELRAAEGAFTIDDVAKGIADKLIRRHPHVFGDAKLDTAGQVLDQWAKLKEKEKPRRTLDGVPRSLPALLRALRVSERAAQVGFDWPDVAGARAKVDEELREIDAARDVGAHDALEHEVGDLLFAAVSLARKLGVDPETALRKTVDRFQGRFEFIEDRLAERGKKPRDSDLAEMDALWDVAKRDSRVTEK